MLNPPKAVKPPKIQRTSIVEFLKGYQSTFSADRQNNDGLRIAANVLAEQNGTIRPRPSLCLYGTQPPGTVLGSVFTYIDSTGATPVNKMICVCLVSGVANAYINQDGGTWTKLTGKNYSTTAKCRFEQINNDVLIMNGSDNLSYFAIGGTTITPFTSLSTPSAPTLAASTSLTSGTPNVVLYYRVSAVNVGETAGSTDTTVTVNTQRAAWNQGGRSGDAVTITITRVTNAKFYNIYVGDQTGLEYYLDTVQDPGSGTTVTYTDNNVVTPNTNRLAPNADSTAGPRVTRAHNYLGQVFLTGDTDNPYRVWFGGLSAATALDLSAFDGGGWIDIDKGGQFFPGRVHGFRDGHGNPAATCFMQGSSGRGKLVHLAETSTTVDNTILTYIQVQEGNGQDGTNSPDAVIYANDRLWYPSRQGFKSTGTNPDMQNILATNDFSQQILPDVLGLNIGQMGAACGLEYMGRLYFSLPVGSASNNQIWVCDLNRGNMWTNPWYLNVDWMWLYDDSNGVTHHMALSGGQICEFSYKQLTTDISTMFQTEIASGLIKFTPDGIEWAQVIDITFIFESPQGQVNVAVTGESQNGNITVLGSQFFVPTAVPTGIDEVGGGIDAPSYYLDAVVGVPTIGGTSRQVLTIPIDQQMDYIGYDITTASAGIDFQLADVIVRWVDIGALLNQNTG